MSLGFLVPTLPRGNADCAAPTSQDAEASNYRFPRRPWEPEEITQYIRSLNSADFTAIDQFMQQENEEFDVIAQQPTLSQLGAEVDSLPPSPPTSNGNILAIMAWSLRLRL